MLNALPYVLLVLACGGLALVRRQLNGEKALLVDVVAVLLFVWFIGFRGFVFYDWTAYYSEFHNLRDFRTLMSLDISKWKLEPGFMMIAQACKWIYPNYTFFQFTLTCIDTVLLVMFLTRYHKNLPLGLMIYLAMGGLVLSTDLMRNSISILLFANSIVFLEKRKPIPYFLMCLLGLTIHSSSIVFIPLYFVLNRKFSKWILLAVFLAANVIYVAHIPVVKSIVLLFVDLLMPSTKLWVETYLEMDAAPSNFLSIGYLERLMSGFLLFVYYDKLLAIRKANVIFVNSMVIYLCLFMFLSEFRTISVRCSTIFSYAYWILWLDFIHCFSVKNNKRLFVSFIVIYSVAKTVGNCHSELASYYNVLFTNHSYQERLFNFRKHFNDD